MKRKHVIKIFWAIISFIVILSMVAWTFTSGF
mgnify:CR=1 FL=1